MKHLLLITFLIFASLSFIKCKPKVLSTKEEKLLTIEMPKKDYKVNVYYQYSNVTIQGSIQMRKQLNGKEDVIKRYERYNCLDTCKLINDSTIMLVIRDTISLLGRNSNPDTMILVIK